MSLEELTSKADQLKNICLNLDPYAPMSEAEVETLKSLGLKELEDPFRLTNELILRMENLLEEIESRKEATGKILQ